MNDVSKILNDKKKYANLKYNVNQIINYLNNIIDALEVPSQKLKDIYTVDSKAIDDEETSSIRQDLISRKKYLENTILVEINKELKDIDNSIEGM